MAKTNRPRRPAPPPQTYSTDSASCGGCGHPVARVEAFACYPVRDGKRVWSEPAWIHPGCIYMPAPGCDPDWCGTCGGAG